MTDWIAPEVAGALLVCAITVARLLGAGFLVFVASEREDRVPGRGSRRRGATPGGSARRPGAAAAAEDRRSGTLAHTR